MMAEQNGNLQQNSALRNWSCLVTGANGFLGINLVNVLVEQRWKVRAGHRPTSNISFIENLPIERILGDITIPSDMEKWVKDIDVVFHVAGDTGYWKRDKGQQWMTNVEGTKNVARACVKAGVKKLVYTSTIDVLGHSENNRLLTEENGQFNFVGWDYYYGESKKAAIDWLRDFCSQEALELIVIYPGFMLGPFDHTLKLGTVFFDLKARKLPGYIPGGGSFCSVEEVAKAHVNAALLAGDGADYICAGTTYTNITHKALWQKIEHSLNILPMQRTLPRKLFVAYAYWEEFLARFTNTPPQVNPGMARYLTSHQYADSSKAIADLGYQVPTIEQMIERTLSWYRKNGYDL